LCLSRQSSRNKTRPDEAEQIAVNSFSWCLCAAHFPARGPVARFATDAAATALDGREMEQAFV